MTTRFADHLLSGNHASRPAATAVPDGTLYSCTTHSLIYQSDGATWSTYATLGTGGSGSITSSGYTQSTARLLGRTTASTGAIEEITVGSGLSLAAGSLTASGGSATPSYLGYNTVGGSTQSMTTSRLYCKQITAGGSGNVLLGVHAYIDITAEAVGVFGFALFADSGSDTIGDLLEITADYSGLSVVLAHSTGVYPARWYGKPLTYELAASTKYWVGIVSLSGGNAPRLYYDGSGSDRYYGLGVGPYAADGAYLSQTNTGNKHSIRALVL